MSHRGALPILVEAGEGQPVKVYWVVADGGMILFVLGGNGLDERRLETAAMIYGLSPAQKQVAALVADGLSVTQIAGRLSITPNTARTHLGRIFDKTGVRTQSALVRMLLTAVAPF